MTVQESQRRMDEYIKAEKELVRANQIGKYRVQFVTVEEYNTLWLADMEARKLDPKLAGKRNWNVRLAGMGYTNLVTKEGTFVATCYVDDIVRVS